MSARREQRFPISSIVYSNCHSHIPDFNRRNSARRELTRRKNASRRLPTYTISFAIRARDARGLILLQPRISLVIIASTDCQSIPISRVSEPISLRLEGAAGSPGRAHARRSIARLARLYRELYRILVGHRASLALAFVGLSLATILKLIPPAATKAMIDYVVHGPAVARTSHSLASLRGPGIAQAASCSVSSSWSCSSRSSASSSG